MREELIRVLNNKLNDISSDIDSLVELNNNISSEETQLSYISNILDLFKENNENNIMYFNKISKDDFNKVLDILGNDIKEVFSSNSCNYDGLVYLINGINEGVSLTLTAEQSNSIQYLIQKLSEKKEEHTSKIEEYNQIKGRYLINDVNELTNKKEGYLTVLDEINNKKYVNNTDLLLESMQFSELPSEKTIDILKYLLEYNAEVYKNGTDLRKEAEEEKNDDIEIKKDEVDINNSLEVKEENNEESSIPEFPPTDLGSDFDQEFHFKNVVKDDFTTFPTFEFNSYDSEKNNDSESNDTDYVPVVEAPVDENNIEDNVDNLKESSYDNVTNNINDYSDYDIEDTKVSTNDLHMLLGKYNIKEDSTYINELVVGDIKNYENVLNILNDNNLVDIFKVNSELLVATLLYSHSDTIEEVLKIIKNDLSVDDDDYVVTTKIVVNTIPSVFIDQNGNYNNFIQNVRTFKELELNLINLFDFSKELFVANHDTIVENLDIVKKYDINITYQNAKYLLLLSNIADRLDYYVESVYEDKVKKATFDGIKYINNYTAKLNVVTDETIKRLRYCSENGKKVFGTKPESLTGDITNLKVNTLDMPGDYLNKFFNNEFAILTGDEVREYIKLIHNSSNVGNYDDELDILEKYHDGLRYVIEGINVSYNKVLRNYSILRSYGIDTKKALQFAVCYNLVITKDEYDKLRSVLDELGGNQ